MQFKKDPNTGLYVLRVMGQMENVPGWRFRGEPLVPQAMTPMVSSIYYNPDDGHLMHITPGHEVIDHGRVGTMEEALEKAKQILEDK